MRKQILFGLGLAVMILMHLGCSGGGGLVRTGVDLNADLAGREFTLQASTSVLGLISTGSSLSLSAGDKISFGVSTFTIVSGVTTVTTGTWVVVDGDTIRVTAGGRSADCDVSLTGSTLVISAMRAVSGSAATGQAGEVMTPPNPQEVLTGQSFTLDEINIAETTYANVTISFTAEQFTVSDGSQVILGGSWTDIGGGVIEVNAYNIGEGFCVPLPPVQNTALATMASKTDTSGSSGTATPAPTPVSGGDGGSTTAGSGTDVNGQENWCNDGILVVPGSEGPDPMPES